MLETLLNSAGYLTSWFRDQFAGVESNSELDNAAARIPPGCDGLLTLPYWNSVQSPYWDPLATGATVGWRGSHTPAHLYRSLLEGVAYELRLQLAGLENATGHPVTSLRAVGGGTNSSLRVQIVADVTRRTILLGSEDEVSAKGAAVLAVAYVSHGGNPGSAAATAAMAWPVRVVEPDLQGAKAYDVYYDVYRDLYPSLRETLRKLAAGAATAS